MSFKSSAYDYAIKDINIGLVGTVINEEKIYSVPKVPQPADIAGKSAFHQDNDPYGLQMKAYEFSLRNQLVEEASLKNKEIHLYGVLWSNCSKLSQEKIQQHSLQAIDSNGNLLYM
jgi:hypothetical protein